MSQTKLLRATRVAIVRARTDLSNALRELHTYEIVGLGGIPAKHLAYVEQHVASADLIIRDLAGALFTAEQAKGKLPSEVVDFLDRFGGE